MRHVLASVIKPALLIAGVSACLLGMLALYLLGGSLYTAVSMARAEHYARTQWRKDTTPLEEETIGDLCLRFELPPEHRLCQPGATVYAPDLFAIIETAFTPGETTYDEVQSKLARYQSVLEPPVAVGDGTVLFSSSYDLRGDGKTELIFVFYENGTLKEVSQWLGGY